LIYPTVDQFPFICANALTPEKLQGVTLRHNIFLGAIDRNGFSEASCYVAYSRVLAAKYLVFTEPASLELLQKFNPPVGVVLELKKILEKLDHPPYMNTVQKEKTDLWIQQENKYCREALDLYFSKHNRRLKNILNSNDN